MKNKLIHSTIILLIGGFITKVLGMVIKIVMARKIGTEGMGLYMLLLPTFTLLINISQFGFPIALSKLISEEKRNNKRLFFSIFPFIILINIIIMILITVFAPLISQNLLHNEKTYLSIIAMAFVIPFTSISSICRSYFFGKGKMIPHVISNIVEDLTRLLLISFGISFFIPLGLSYAVCFLILSNVISEIASTLILIIFLPRNIKITKNDLKPNKKYLKDSLKISIPNTGSRLIGSIGYFLEPIILTTILLKVGYSISYITKEYGIITGYVLPIVLLPSFFTLAMSQAILPIISYASSNNQINKVKKTLTFSITMSLLLGGILTIFLILKPEYLLNILYHTNEGVNYIRIMAPICLLQYIQSPLTSCLDAIGKSKDNFKIALTSTIIRTLSLFFLCYLKIGMLSYMLSTFISISFTTFYQIKVVRNFLS